MRMYFPVYESLEDLPPVLSRPPTKEARLGKLEELWEKGIYGKGEYETFKYIIEAS